jgi:uncharacterized membrane protein YcjF (UPF0283 family)
LQITTNPPAYLCCSYCGKKFLPNKLPVHLRFFCGPDAHKSEDLAKQQKKRKTAGQQQQAAAAADEDQEEEEAVSTEEPEQEQEEEEEEQGRSCWWLLCIGGAAICLCTELQRWWKRLRVCMYTHF